MKKLGIRAAVVLAAFKVDLACAFVQHVSPVSSAVRSFSLIQNASLQKLDQKYNAIIQNKYKPRTASSLELHAATPFFPNVHGYITCSNNLRAIFSLLFASLLGVQMDQRLDNSGILVSLFTTAVLSNCKFAPTVNPVYDLCWKVFLPASLVLLLLSMKKDNTTTNDNNDSMNTSYKIDPETTVAASIKRVAIPFLIVSLGSIVGCALAFLLCQNFPQAWMLSPRQALMACACLVASYVGGSVNFMAVAASLSSSSTSTAVVVVQIKSLVSSMAAADLVLMALYFAMLSAALESTTLRNLFIDNNKQQQQQETVETTKYANDKNTSIGQNTVDYSSVMAKSSIKSKCGAGISVTILALAIVQFANNIETVLSPFVPGTACAVITIVAPAIVHNIPTKLKVWQQMQSIAKPLSEVFFLLLFASIGMSADVKAAMQVGPACFFVTGIALSVHIVLALAGNLLARRFFREIRLEDVLIASNAAIGGPATAATFCGRIKGPRQKGLTMAASFWGVVGYAIGTTIGVTFYRVLQRLYF